MLSPPNVIVSRAFEPHLDVKDGDLGADFGMVVGYTDALWCKRRLMAGGLGNGRLEKDIWVLVRS